jgi:hypothetical protein
VTANAAAERGGRYRRHGQVHAMLLEAHCRAAVS